MGYNICNNLKILFLKIIFVIFICIYFLFNFLFICCITSQKIYCSEYLYPVANVKIDGKDKIYVIHQKSINHLELWLWDPVTKIATKGLLSSYTPAALKILPSLNGFSFIDDGRIRIKKFNKRSPKSIDLYQPLYNISQIYWIDEDNFYLSAIENDKFAIFHVNTDDVIFPILQDKNIDFLYPQKIGDKLFYIERKTVKMENGQESSSYKIFETIYPDFKKIINNKIEELKSGEIIQSDSKSFDPGICIANLQENSIAFLTMIDENQGYFLQHQNVICKHDKFVYFDCFEIKRENNIKKEDNNWMVAKLFSFSIPSSLILDSSDSCLYESILPLIPKCNQKKLYFVDFEQDESSNSVFYYDLNSNKIVKIYDSKKGNKDYTNIVFLPIFAQKSLFLGGKVDYTENLCLNCPIKMWIGDDGSFYIDFINI